MRQPVTCILYTKDIRVGGTMAIRWLEPSNYEVVRDEGRISILINNVPSIHDVTLYKRQDKSMFLLFKHVKGTSVMNYSSKDYHALEEKLNLRGKDIFQEIDENIVPVTQMYRE